MVVFNVVLERSVAVAVAVAMDDDEEGGEGANKGDAEEEFAEEVSSPVFVDAHLLWRKERG